MKNGTLLILVIAASCLTASTFSHADGLLTPDYLSVRDGSGWSTDYTPSNTLKFQDGVSWGYVFDDVPCTGVYEMETQAHTWADFDSSGNSWDWFYFDSDSGQFKTWCDDEYFDYVSGTYTYITGCSEDSGLGNDDFDPFVASSHPGSWNLLKTKEKTAI